MEIAFDGTNYHGWQIQQNAHSVQAELNNALSTILRTEINVVGAGRTDTGVHAKQMFVHFELEESIDWVKMRKKLNGFLPDDISCKDVFRVNDLAHTRFSATSRSYEYWITLEKDPFLLERAYHYLYDLDVDVMNKAAEKLMNYKDFSCFSKSKTQTATNDCTITEARWEQKEDLLIFTISANRFLRNMVRAIVGTLLEVGSGRMSIEQFEEVINLKDRRNAGASVPAHGLYLNKISYPKDITEYGE